MAYLGNIYCQSVMVAFIFDRIIMGKSVMAFICDRITMGKIINIISHNVKPAAHKSFYNLATMAVKGNTDNKFNFFCRAQLCNRIKIKTWSWFCLFF